MARRNKDDLAELPPMLIRLQVFGISLLISPCSDITMQVTLSDLQQSARPLAISVSTKTNLFPIVHFFYVTLPGPQRSLRTNSEIRFANTRSAPPRNLVNKKHNLIASFHCLLDCYSLKLIYNMLFVRQTQTNSMATLLGTRKAVLH